MSNPFCFLQCWCFALTKRASWEILKIFTILFFNQFHFFITTCLCFVEIDHKIFHFNWNDSMVLFKWGWWRLINKPSLIRSLNLFASEARTWKWSKYIEQLHSSRWSEIHDCLTLIRCFQVKLDNLCYAALVKNWQYVLQWQVTLQLLHGYP